MLLPLKVERWCVCVVGGGGGGVEWGVDKRLWRMLTSGFLPETSRCTHTRLVEFVTYQRVSVTAHDVDPAS